MAKYVIGDIHGCGHEFELLLQQLQFNPEQDQLYLIGDLVGRGPEPQKVLDLAMANQAQVTLGNWDLHFLCCMANIRHAKASDNFDQLLALPAAQQAKYRDWLLQQHLVIDDPNFLLVHASVSPLWTLEQIKERASQAMDFVRQAHEQANYQQFKSCFSGLFIDGLREDTHFDAKLRHNLESLIVLTINREQVLKPPSAPTAIFLEQSLQQQLQQYHQFTHEQALVTSKLGGIASKLSSALLQHTTTSIVQESTTDASNEIMIGSEAYSTLVTDYSQAFVDFDRACKGRPVYDFAHGYFPWFAAQQYRTHLQQHQPELLAHNPNLQFQRIDKPIFFGHWSMLNGHQLPPGFICTDTSCVYGGKLSAFKLPEMLITNEQELLALAQPIAQVARLTDIDTVN